MPRVDDEKLMAWWDHLPDRARDDLMDDPGQDLAADLERQVSEAGVLVTGGQHWVEPGDGSGPHLPPTVAAFVRARAAEREAGMAP